MQNRSPAWIAAFAACAAAFGCFEGEQRPDAATTADATAVHEASTVADTAPDGVSAGDLDQANEFDVGGGFTEAGPELSPEAVDGGQDAENLMDELALDTPSEFNDGPPGDSKVEVSKEVIQNPDAAPADTGPTACPIGATATSSHPTLVPMPVKVQLTAASGGKPCLCQWASTTPAVCAVTPEGTVQKVGDGLCEAHCIVGGTQAASFELQAAAQWIIYYVGGFCEDAPWAEAMPCGTQLWRWRASDSAWDVDFAQLPEVRGDAPVVFARGHTIWVGGGYSYGTNPDGFYQAGGWKDGSVAPKCPEALAKSLGGTAEEDSCRAFRRLDLDTGQWDSPFEWKHPRSTTLYTDTGSLIWVSHGGTYQDKPTPFPWAGEVIDPDKQITYDLAIPPTATFWPQASPSALWGDQVVQGNYSNLGLIDAKTLSKFKPFPDPDWPCKWESISSMVTFPGTQTLMIFGGGKEGAPCSAKPYIDPKNPLLQWLPPIIYAPGSGWTVGDPLPSYLGKFVAAGDKLYFAATGGIARLDSPTAKWVWVAGMPKPPIYRTGYNVVAVWQ